MSQRKNERCEDGRDHVYVLDKHKLSDGNCQRICAKCGKKEKLEEMNAVYKPNKGQQING